MIKKLLYAFAFLGLVPACALAQYPVLLGDTSKPIYFQATSSSDHVSEKTDASSVTCKFSKNGGATASCGGSTAEVSDADTPGTWKYTFVAGDVDTAGNLVFRFSATGMDPVHVPVVIDYPVNLTKVAASAITEAGFAARNTAQAVTASTIQLAASESFADSELNNNTAVHIVSATTGAGQTRCIKTYVGSTDTATLLENWTTTPTGAITYNLIPSPHCDTLEPATAGRTVLVNSTGGVAVDWANVQNPTTSVTLSSTTINSAGAGASRKW